jgi:hypothetical protein
MITCKLPLDEISRGILVVAAGTVSGICVLRRRNIGQSRSFALNWTLGAREIDFQAPGNFLNFVAA